MPTTSLYGIKVVPKVVDFTKIPWRYGGQGNVFEVPKMDVKDMAAILKKEGFQEDDTFHAFSSTPDGPKVYVDAHEFTRTTKAGTTETVSIMKCDGVSALMHWEPRESAE